jgi:hypothetical protein
VLYSAGVNQHLIYHIALSLVLYAKFIKHSKEKTDWDNFPFVQQFLQLAQK